MKKLRIVFKFYCTTMTCAKQVELKADTRTELFNLFKESTNSISERNVSIMQTELWDKLKNRIEEIEI